MDDRHRATSDTSRSTRLTRRTALIGAAAGLATATSPGTHGHAHGDDATPNVPAEATPAAAGVSLLFVQTFAACSLSPTGDDGVLTLLLEGGTGQTIYFADHPGRQVGSIATGPFMEVFRRETAGDPANAALVAGNGQSEETIYVVEFIDMQYDESTATATYTVRLLADPTVVTFALAGDPAMRIDDEMSHQVSTLFIDSGGLMQLVAYGAQDVYGDDDGRADDDACR